MPAAKTRKKVVASNDDTAVQFLRDANAQGTNYADQPKMVLLATCIISQQSAGFGETVDLRVATCENCGAAGFNTGWGYWKFVCGAEVLTDGEDSEPCGAREEQT